MKKKVILLIYYLQLRLSADRDSHCDRVISRRDIAKWKEICFYVAKAQYQGADGESKMCRPLFQLSRQGKKVFLEIKTLGN